MIPKAILKKVRALEISTRKIVQSTFSGDYHSVFKGQGLSFADLREYQPGDDVRNIHWSVSAKMNSPHIKLYDEERELTVFILVDLSGSGEFGSMEKTKVEIAAEISAILGFSAIRNNDKVGLVLFTDEVELFIPAKKGKDHILRLLRDIFYVKPKSRKTNIGKALDYFMNMVTKKSVVFLISDFLDNHFEKSLKVVSRKHDVIPIVIEDPRELDLPKAGIIVLEDEESGEVIHINSNSQSLREAYKNIRYANQMKTDRYFKKMNLDWVRLNLSMDYIKPLALFFKKRLKKI